MSLEDHNEELYRIRHSLAHIMAQAVLEVRPGTKLGFGPAIDDGFYYDFILSEPLTEDDFKTVEKTMIKIINQKQEFVMENLPYEEAMKRLDDMGEPYKKEYAVELFEKNNLKTLTFYRNGPFLDMCEGPHINNTKDIPRGCFKLRSIAGAYWRGDSHNQMMTRIYAFAFESKDKLNEYVKAYEEAQKRDHKKLGKELEIFHIDHEIGKGLPLWLPNGTVIRDEIEKFMEELEFQDEYKRVATPQITKTGLYYKTGHFPYYKAHTFPLMELKENGENETEEVIHEAYCLRPMNCPHHHKIFAASPKSYRDLPLRLAEYGDVYRFEDSGTLTGLARVRGMCMNDAHIYCTEDQIKGEFLKVMRMTDKLYKTLGLDGHFMRLSTWDPEDPKGKEKYVDNPEAWEKSQDLVREAMVESGIPFKEVKGEAAFYGPKIDVQFKLVTGREETISTNQLDFAVPERLDLKYTDSENQEKRPYVIHRAPASTHERFIAFLIEHFGGAFPTWLAPVQVKIITVNPKFDEYAKSIVSDLRSQFVRIELDTSTDSLNKKIRTHTKKKIPNILIIGENEVENKSVTVRRYGVEKQETIELNQFKDWLMSEIKERKLPPHMLS